MRDSYRTQTLSYWITPAFLPSFNLFIPPSFDPSTRPPIFWFKWQISQIVIFPSSRHSFYHPFIPPSFLSSFLLFTHPSIHPCMHSSFPLCTPPSLLPFLPSLHPSLLPPPPLSLPPISLPPPILPSIHPFTLSFIQPHPFFLPSFPPSLHPPTPPSTHPPIIDLYYYARLPCPGLLDGGLYIAFCICSQGQILANNMIHIPFSECKYGSSGSISNNGDIICCSLHFIYILNPFLFP